MAAVHYLIGGLYSRPVNRSRVHYAFCNVADCNYIILVELFGVVFLIY